MARRPGSSCFHRSATRGTATGGSGRLPEGPFLGGGVFPGGGGSFLHRIEHGGSRDNRVVDLQGALPSPGRRGGACGFRSPLDLLDRASCTLRQLRGCPPGDPLPCFSPGPCREPIYGGAPGDPPWRGGGGGSRIKSTDGSTPDFRTARRGGRRLDGGAPARWASWSPPSPPPGDGRASWIPGQPPTSPRSGFPAPLSGALGRAALPVGSRTGGRGPASGARSAGATLSHGDSRGGRLERFHHQCCLHTGRGTLEHEPSPLVSPGSPHVHASP